MKKLLLLLCCSIVIGSLFSQSKWLYGLNIEGGFSGEPEKFANSTYDYQSKIQPSVGAGLWLERRLTKHWGINLAANYLQLTTFSQSEKVLLIQSQVARYEGEKNGVYQHQLQLPLNIRFYFGQPSKRGRFFISGGMQAQYLLKHTNFHEELKGLPGSVNIERTELTTVDFDYPLFEYRRLQFAAIAGVGYYTDRFSFTARRSWSVGNYRTTFSELRCGTPLGFGCFGPWVVGTSEKLLQQTSVIIQYRLH